MRESPVPTPALCARFHHASELIGRRWNGAPDAIEIFAVIGRSCLLLSHHLSEVSMPILSSLLDREQLIAWYRRNRQRSSAIFGLVADEAYYSRPIAQRHPLVFYEGHLPAFSFNTLVNRGLGQPSIDERLQSLFARGIDPSENDHRSGNAVHWPERSDVRQFADEADRRVIAALTHADLDQPGHPLLDRAEAAFAILEHEAMHQETLLYMWHRLPFEQKRKPSGYEPRVEGTVPSDEWIEVPAGRAMLGVDRSSIPF